MKKSKFSRAVLALASLFLLFLTAGCEKDTEFPPEPVGEPVILSEYTISNGIVTLNWDIDKADSCKLQDKLVSFVGNVSFNNCDTILIFKAFKNGVIYSKSTNVDKMPLPEIIIGDFDTLCYGGGVVSIPYMTTNATGLVVNDTGFYKPQGILNFGIITTTVINIKVLGDGGVSSYLLTIPVHIPLDMELAMLGSFELKKEEGSYYNNDGPWVKFSGPNGTSLTFCLCPRMMIVNTQSGLSSTSWTMRGDSIIELNRKIISITESELVLEYESISIQPGGPVPWFVRETYSRVN